MTTTIKIKSSAYVGRKVTHFDFGGIERDGVVLGEFEDRFHTKIQIRWEDGEVEAVHSYRTIDNRRGQEVGTFVMDEAA